MAKIALVVFSLVSVLLIQFVEGQDAGAALPLEKQKDWFINSLKDVVQDLIMDGVVDPSALKSNAQKADFEEAYEVAKNETAHQIVTARDRGSTTTENQLSLDDEKNVFYSSLAYLLEKWASKGFIDHEFMRKNLLTGPEMALQAKYDSQLTKLFQDARTKEKNDNGGKTKHDL